MATGQFCLKWNNFHNSIVTAFESLQSTEELVDVTLMCEGRNVKAHKVILSACSPYFRNLFKETPCKHPIIILKDVLYCDLVAILQFMYQGEVLVDQDGLASFLKTAELLQVSGLAGSTSSAAAAGIPEELNNIPPSSVPSNKITVPTTTKPETLCPARTKTPPSSPKPPPLVKVRNDIIPVVEPSVIEKENIILTREEPEDEPMQSCSYQTAEDVIIKTESADDQDYHELDYLDPMDDPGSTTTEEQSILERSLKAQGDISITDFRLSVVEGLLKYEDQPEVERPRLSRGQHLRSHQFTKLDCKARENRKYCIGCYKKKKDGLINKNKIKKVITYCIQCEGNPRFCLECFNNFHKK